MPNHGHYGNFTTITRDRINLRRSTHSPQCLSTTTVAPVSTILFYDVILFFCQRHKTKTSLAKSTNHLHMQFIISWSFVYSLALIGHAVSSTVFAYSPQVYINVQEHGWTDPLLLGIRTHNSSGSQGNLPPSNYNECTVVEPFSSSDLCWTMPRSYALHLITHRLQQTGKSSITLRFDVSSFSTSYQRPLYSKDVLQALVTNIFSPYISSARRRSSFPNLRRQTLSAILIRTMPALSGPLPLESVLFQRSATSLTKSWQFHPECCLTQTSVLKPMCARCRALRATNTIAVVLDMTLNCKIADKPPAQVALMQLWQ